MKAICKIFILARTILNTTLILFKFLFEIVLAFQVLKIEKKKYNALCLHLLLF